MNFRELIESREYNYIGMVYYASVDSAIDLKHRIQDELKINVHFVEYLKCFDGETLYAYFVEDVKEEKIERARDIIKIWKGEHDEFYDDVLGKFASPEMIQILSAK